MMLFSILVDIAGSVKSKMVACKRKWIWYYSNLACIRDINEILKATCSSLNIQIVSFPILTDLTESGKSKN